MEPFISHTGRGVPLRRSNVDTDQIIPASYLKRVSRTGFGDGLFAAWREDPAFVLNQPAYAGATILIAGTDFGIGSSREHAVWALADYGFRVVIAPRFGDIFRTNATKAGLLPVRLPADVVSALHDAVESDPATQITVDLGGRTVSCRRPPGRPCGGGRVRPAGRLRRARRRRRAERAVRDRRLHAVAADGGPRRHRPHPP